MAALTTRCTDPKDSSCVTRGVYTWLIMPALNQVRILRWPLADKQQPNTKGDYHDARKSFLPSQDARPPREPSGRWPRTRARPYSLFTLQLTERAA
jgi:hypothetical protein